MGFICGVVDLSSEKICFERFNKMGKSMGSARERGAYVWRGVSLMSGGESCALRSVELDGRRLVILTDGQPKIARSAGVEGRAGLYEGLAACYLKHGKACAEFLRGEFSVVIYDELYRELFIARDRDGSSPIFYRREGNGLVFASEIKAILAYVGEGMEVDSSAVREIVLGESLCLRADDIYGSICEIPSASIALLTPLGLQISSYRTPEAKIVTGLTPTRLPLTFCRLEESLQASLRAFDYPAFDEYICSLTDYLSEHAKIGALCFEDKLTSLDAKYARERAVAIGRRFGVRLLPLEARGEGIWERYGFYTAQKKLCAMATELLGCGRVPYPIFDASVLEIIALERDSARRIRMYGRLIQSVYWLESYRVIPV